MADLISKQDVLNEIVRFSTEEGSSVECQQLYCDVNNMPAYKKPKTGHWIPIQESVGIFRYKCDKCGRYNRAMSDYCPNCGANMESEG